MNHKINHTLTHVLHSLFEGSYSVHYDTLWNKYSLKNYTSPDDPIREFFKLLEQRLQGNFTSSFNLKFNQADGLRKKIVLHFFKNAPLHEWQSAFDAFFAQIPIQDLFDSFKLKSGSYKTKDHPYDPILLFLLKQKYPSINGKDIVNILKTPFVYSEDNYQDYKNSLLLFLEQHYELGKNSYSRFASSSLAGNEVNRQYFDLDIYEAIKKVIKPEDVKEFSFFWQHISREETVEPLFSKPTEKYIILSLSYPALIQQYSTFSNTVYANKACHQLISIFKDNFSSYCDMINIKEEINSFQLLINCHEKRLTEDMLNNILSYALNVINESEKILPYHSQGNHVKQKQLHDIYVEGIENIKKHLEYELLNDELPNETIVTSKPKI